MTEVQKEPSKVEKWLNAFGNCVRKQFSFISVQDVYRKPLISAGSDLEDISTEFSLYKAFSRQKQPPIVIYDTDGFVVRGKLNYSLTSMSKNEQEEFRAKLPEKVRTDLDALTLNYGPSEKTFVYFRPVPALKNIEFVKQIEWRELVAQIVNFKDAKMDERLKLVRKATLPRGFKQACNPHGIVCLPGMTGKSDWYDIAGIKSERVKAVSLIGYSDTDGPHPGSLDGTELPYAIDQFESQGEWNIFRYLTSLLESGQALIDTGAQPFLLKCLSTLVMLSNPASTDPTKSFKFLTDHMTRVPAFGRRVGFILYDKNAVRLESREADLDTWKQLFEIFRAVEESCKSEILKVMESAWPWLNKKSEEWIRSAKSIIAPLEEQNLELHSFLLEFASNNATHVRGGALRAAIADNLDKIALKTLNMDELLAEAEDIYVELLSMNADSLRNIVQNYAEEAGTAVKVFIDTCPGYLKDIIFAVELFKRYSKERPAEVDITTIDYKPETREYLSQVVELANRGNPEKRNADLKDYFKFELVRKGKQILARIYDYEGLHILDNLHNFTMVREDGGQGKLEGGSPKSCEIVENVQNVQKRGEQLVESSRQLIRGQKTDHGADFLSCKEHPDAWFTTEQWQEHVKREHPSSPVGVREAALEVFKKLQGEPKQPVENKAFFEELTRDGKFTKEQAEKVFQDMWKSGVIYEVRPGFFKRAL